MTIYILRLTKDFILLMDEVESLGKIEYVFSTMSTFVAIKTLLSKEELEANEFVVSADENTIGKFYRAP